MNRAKITGLAFAEMDEISALRLALERERATRKAAERVIEEKTIELFQKNEELLRLNHSLEEKVSLRTAELQEKAEALEKAHKESERASRVFSSMVQGMTMSDAAGNFVYVNNAYAEMVGVSTAEILGKSPMDFVPEEDRVTLNEQRKNRIAGEPTQYEHRIRRTDGTLLDVAVTGVPIFEEGKYTGNVAIVSDLSALSSSRRLIKQRERLIEGVALALNNLLLSDDLSVSIAGALKLIGEATLLDRAYIFKNQILPIDGSIGYSMKYEWCASGIDSHLHNPEMQNVAFHPHFSDQYAALSTGKLYGGLVHDLPEGMERQILLSQQIKSFLIVPIFSEDQFWGFIGLDDCRNDRIWSEGERAILMAVAAGIGAKLARQKTRDLIESQRGFYEEILNSIPSDIVVFTPEHKYLFVNPAAIKNEEIRKWIIGKDDFEYCAYRGKPSDVAEFRRKAFLKAVESRALHQWEERMIQPDGTEKWALRHSKPVFIADGSMQMVIGYGLDITERKHAEQQVEEAAAKLRHVQKIAHMGSFEVTFPDGRIHFSDEIFAMLSLPTLQEALNPASLRKFIHPEDEARLIQAFQTAIASVSPLNLEFRLLSDQEKIVYVSVNAEPVLRDGRVVRLVGSVFDITERRNKDREIRMLAKFPEENPLPVLRVQANGKLLYANKPAEQLWEYIHENFESLFAGIFKKAFQKGLSSELELEVDDRFYGLTIAPIMEFGYVNIYARDITTRIQQANELMKARVIAEESNRAKEKFLANVSHEIRTPLNGMTGIIQLFETTALTEKQQEWLGILRDSSDYLLSLINEILDFSKIEEGLLNLSEHAFSLGPVLEGVVQNVQKKIAEKGLSFQVTGIELFDKPLLGDPVRIRQVMLNLLSNAVKFTHSGSISVHCSVLETSEKGLKLAIDVSDTGIGIAEDQLNRIFAPFTQAETDNPYQYGGTGLGLSIVKELIERMGGIISVKSSPRKGTTFTVLLSLAFATDAEPEFVKRSEFEAKDLSGVRILLVDDHEINRVVASSLLKNWNAEVYVAVNGAEAIQKLYETEVDAVIMDMQMPVMDGIDATRFIRASGTPFSNIPIIAMTAAALPEEREKCLQSGMNDYISKPFKADHLFALLAHYTASKELKKDELPALPSQSLASFDLTYLRELSDGTQELMDEVIQAFVREMPAYINAILEELHHGDRSKAGAIAHKAKSMAGYLGCDGIRLELSSIESELLSDKPVSSNLPHRAELLVQAIDDVIKVLQSNK